MRDEARNVLVVEDSSDLIDLWKELFCRAGIEATFAQAGKEALLIVRGGFIPDILMTDYYLPDMTGDTLIGEIKKINRRVRALIVTGNNNHDFRCSLPPDVDILVKPVKFGQLREKIESLKKKGDRPSDSMSLG